MPQATMKVELIDRSMRPEETCGRAAALCRGIRDPNEDQIKKSLNIALDDGHMSISELGHYTFLVTGVSRAMSHQLVRHRLFSFSQESQRHATPNLYIIPKSFTLLQNRDLLEKYIDHVEKSFSLCQEFIDCGIPREDARFVYPNATETALFVGGNSRQFVHFFDERICSRAQWEIAEMATKMMKICKEIAPNIFKQSWPNCKGCPEPCGNSLVIG